MSIFGRFLLVGSVALFASEAAAVVLDFESLEHVDALTESHGLEHSEDGFELSTFDFLGFATFGTEEPRFSGSTALFNDAIGGVTLLRHGAGLAFSLSSIDLTELNGPSMTAVTFVGFGLGPAVLQTFVLDGNAFQPETFVFGPEFSNLSLVTWTQSAPFHQFDNIVVEAVPEPASLALVALGVLALGLYRRRANPTAERSMERSLGRLGATGEK